MISIQQLHELQSFDSATSCNAIEGFLAEACRKAAAAEWPVLSYVKEALLQNTELDMEELSRRMREMNQLRSKIADHAPNK